MLLCGSSLRWCWYIIKDGHICNKQLMDAKSCCCNYHHKGSSGWTSGLLSAALRSLWLMGTVVSLGRESVPCPRSDPSSMGESFFFPCTRHVSMYLRPGIVILKFVLSHGVLFLLVSSAIDVATAVGWCPIDWVFVRAMVTADGLRRDAVRAMVTADGTHAPWLRRDVHARHPYVQWLQQMGCV